MNNEQLPDQCHRKLNRFLQIEMSGQRLEVNLSNIALADI